MPTAQPDLDALIWGAGRIAIAAGIVDGQGKPLLDRVYYKLEKGQLPASKIGREWITTLRRIRTIAE